MKTLCICWLKTVASVLTALYMMTVFCSESFLVLPSFWFSFKHFMSQYTGNHKAMLANIPPCTVKKTNCKLCEHKVLKLSPFVYTLMTSQSFVDILCKSCWQASIYYTKKFVLMEVVVYIYSSQTYIYIHVDTVYIHVHVQCLVNWIEDKYL